MEREDCREVALLHGERFARPWGDGEFHGLLMQDTVFGFVARQTNAILKKPLPGFILARHGTRRVGAPLNFEVVAARLFP